MSHHRALVKKSTGKSDVRILIKKFIFDFSSKFIEKWSAESNPGSRIYNQRKPKSYWDKFSALS